MGVSEKELHAERERNDRAQRNDDQRRDVAEGEALGEKKKQAAEKIARETREDADRYAMRVLWALKDGHPQTFRILQESVGSITPNTLNTRIKELRAAGLMTHGTSGYTVTTLGADLLKRMNDVQAFATKWIASQSKTAVVKAPVVKKK